MTGSHEVRGSIPLGSTKFRTNGCNVNYFYAGERICPSSLTITPLKGVKT
jgi:hypothetical protein